MSLDIFEAVKAINVADVNNRCKLLKLFAKLGDEQMLLHHVRVVQLRPLSKRS